MANQHSNQRASERDEKNKKSTLSTSGYERNFPQQPGDIEPFSDPANEWQRTGHSSDQSWWESGTDQQQRTYSGDTAYPYRENYRGRNQQDQGGIENYYPQEPASEQQRRNFAEGSQYPYEGGYGAANLQDREGLERANEWKGRDLNRQSLNRNRNQARNQSLNTMRSDERNFRGGYENRDQDYGRDRYSSGDSTYGYESGRGGHEYDRNNYRGGFDRERDFRGYDRNREYNMDQYERAGRNNAQGRDYDRYEGRQGRYHSTETDRPGQGFDTEREMNRNANRGGFDSDRSYGNSSRNYRGERGYNPPLSDRVASSHRATGPYEDFERDREYYGAGRDYQERYRSIDRADRGREENAGFYNRPDEEAEHRRRSNQFRDRGWERSPRGNWGPSDPDYRSRYEDDRRRY